MTSLRELKEEVRESVREAIREYIEENPDIDNGREIIQNINDDGRIHEIVDGAVPIYSQEILDVGRDSEIYGHANELPPAFDGEPTPINIIATSIYEVLDETAWEEINDVVKELENDDCFDDEETLKKCVKEL